MIHAHIPHQLCVGHDDADRNGLTLHDLNAFEAEHEAVDLMYRQGEFVCMGCFDVKPTSKWLACKSFTEPFGHRRFIYGAYVLCAECTNSKTKQRKAHRAAKTQARDMAERGQWGGIC